MKFERFICDFEKYKHLRNQEEVFQFEQAIANLVNMKDPECIPILMNYLDDKCEFPEVMYSIVHAIESFSDEQYIPQIIKYLPLFVEKTPFWIDCLYNRLFNSLEALEVFKKHLYLLPEREGNKLFNIMEKESPHHRELIAELRQELNTQQKN